MGVLVRIVMQSCVNAKTFDINKIIYMTHRLFPNGRIRNCLGYDNQQSMPQSQVSHNTPTVLHNGCAGIPGQVLKTIIIVIMNNDSLASCR